MKYRMWITEPIIQDQANLYLVRYEEDSGKQWYFKDGHWLSFPQMGVVEPMVVFVGRDYMGDRVALVEQLKGSLR